MTVFERAKISAGRIRDGSIFKTKLEIISISAFLLFLLSPVLAFASEGNLDAGAHNISLTLFGIVVILFAARVSSLVERFGQPAVLGELLIGVFIGNVTLLGFHFFEPIKGDFIIAFLAELGVIILLFQIGLESNIGKMKKVGPRAFLVGCVGVIVPFVLGTYVVGPWLLPGLTFNAYLLIGATLTATSVGITARVFKDLKKIHTVEAQIVLGAAVIDDVLGLIILAVVSAVATIGGVGLGVISLITAKAILFLIGSIVFGKLFALKICKLFASIHDGAGAKFTLAMCFCLVFALLAEKAGLAPIIGAFVAGLILSHEHFSCFKDAKIIRDVRKVVDNCNPKIKQNILSAISTHNQRHVDDLIAPIGLFLVPIFFVFTGMSVRLETLFNPSILLVSLGITIVAVVGKLVSGLVAGKANKYIVGFGMVPRGEVGLIFAMTGKTLNIISDGVFSVLVIMVILTTLVIPPILNFLLKKQEKIQKISE